MTWWWSSPSPSPEPDRDDATQEATAQAESVRLLLDRRLSLTTCRPGNSDTQAVSMPLDVSRQDESC
jgi:hypothetical protein